MLVGARARSAPRQYRAPGSIDLSPARQRPVYVGPVRPTIRGKLCVPAFLAVTTVGAPGCADKPTTTTTTDSSTGTETTPTTSPTTTESAATTTGTTTGEPVECSTLADQAACMTESTCYWFPPVSQCIFDCEQIKSQAACNMQDFCSWYDDEGCRLVLA